MPFKVPEGIHPLFLRTIPDVPLTAELYEYSLAGGIRTLAVRYRISRDGRGSVYLGVCAHPASFGEPEPPFAVVCIWDVPSMQLKLRVAGSQEQVNGGPGTMFPGGPHLQVLLDRSRQPRTHLGYTLYSVEGQPHLWYCPSLESAMTYTAENTSEFVIQAVARGEPSLEEYGRNVP